MKSIVRYSLLTLAVMLMLVKPSDAQAQHSFSYRFYLAQSQPDMYEMLGVSPEQRQMLDANRQRHKSYHKSMSSQIKVKRAALKKELSKPDLDHQRIDALKYDLNELQIQKMNSRLDSIIEVREILTPEQFEKFNQMTQ